MAHLLEVLKPDLPIDLVNLGIFPLKCSTKPVAEIEMALASDVCQPLDHMTPVRNLLL